MSKECKKCGFESDDVETYFGYRRDRGVTREQPWCRKCRIRYSRFKLPKDRGALATLYKSTYPADKAQRSIKFMEDKLLGKLRRKEIKVI